MADKSTTSAGSLPLSTVATLAVVAALYFAKEILLPIALAVLLTFVLTPLVKWLERWRLGRVASVMIVAAVSFSMIGGVAWLATNQVIELSNRLPDHKDNLIAKIRAVRVAGGSLEKAKEALQDIGKELTEGEANVQEGETTPPAYGPRASYSAAEPPSAEQGEAVSVKVVELPPLPLSQFKMWLGPLVAPLATAGIVIVLVIFMLLKREDLRDRMFRLFGTAKLPATTEAIDDAAYRLSSYLRMQLLINMIYGVVVGVALSLIGVPNAFLWGVFGTLLRFLPYVGPWIAAAMPITLSLAVSEGWSQPLVTIGFFVVLELIVNNVLEPWLYGSSVGLSSMGVILAALFWTWLWGPVGLVLAVPLTVCLVVLGNYVPRLALVPALLGDRSALRPHEQLYYRLLVADDSGAGELADDYLRTGSLIEWYDDVLIPALHLAELDRHAGLLSDQQETEVIESAREVVEYLRDRHETQATTYEVASVNGEDAEATRSRVFCIPARDQADTIVATMLGQMLSREGFLADVGSLDLLAGEMVERIEGHNCDVAALVVLPPLGSRHARYLCKRLRQGNPDVSIVVALLDGEDLKRTQQRLLDSGADVITASLRDTIGAVRQAVKNRRQTKNERSPPHPVGLPEG